MLVDRYQGEDVFARVPQMAQRIDPVLKELDQLLDDDALYRQVRADFGQRHRYTLVHGRHSTPVEVLLRLLIVKHLHQWSYQDTEEQVDQNLILRWFCRLYWAPVPDDTTLIRWTNTLQPQTLHALNDRVVQLARQAKVTKGRSRFVQRDQGLINDQVRNVQQVCRSRLRTARRVAQTLHRQLRRKGEDKEAQQKELYQKLIQTAEQMVQQSRRVVAVLGTQTQRQAQRLLEQAQRVLPLVERVITQTRTRVLEGKKVASEQKVLSLFEPHTRAIPRHKGGALVEFGRHVVLDEVDGGIVTRYPLFEHPPNLVAGDRGVHSPDTEEHLSAAGVKLMAIPAVGKGSAVQHTRSFKRGYRWRAGIEGRIASLRRDFGWRKSAYHGEDGMERWLGLGVIASNLRRIARAKGA